MSTTRERQHAPPEVHGGPLRGGRVMWLYALVLALCACGSKSPSELEAERRAAVRSALSRHLDHEEQMLELLELHRQTPDVAARELVNYTTRHADDLEALCSQRRLLETEPDALAAALAELSDRSQSVFSRRRALYDSAPALMEHPDVKRALSRLDTL